MLVGELVGARLIAHAGSLMNLAKHPASTVQILGAEKALFKVGVVTCKCWFSALMIVPQAKFSFTPWWGINVKAHHTPTDDHPYLDQPPWQFFNHYILTIPKEDKINRSLAHNALLQKRQRK